MEMQHDLYGDQKRIWAIIRNRNKTVNKEVQVININSESWITHFKNLYEREGGKKRKEKRRGKKKKATAVKQDETEELLMRHQDITEDGTEEEENISQLPAGDHLAEHIYVNRIQNKNLQNLYASHTDLCSQDPSRDFQDETTVKVHTNESFKKYKMSDFKRPNKER
jgi:hypothetical protein